MRSSLEELAAGLATERLDDGSREKIQEALDNFREAIQTDDNPKIADCDVEFHDAVFEATQNKRLIQIINNLREQIYRYRLEYVKDTAYHAVLLKEHEELVEAMFAGNKERAKEIMKRHIDNQEETVIKKNPGRRKIGPWTFRQNSVRAHRVLFFAHTTFKGGVKKWIDFMIKITK